ncbi:hypothetical protein HS088_TW15G00830 [Tripterygium wilfordii]|uniref:S1 motif domain-containing protein n=1 Tax=Tripterygium wilfordii TaxID=458696 RepID=A0A7J7CMV3_TRIWF|nr:protein PIGMENT DEFECTIVE 338, chloroplastic-like [Tripterygium wilfordii]KAF5735328.1 hypothetical protein HS088_TW15G00830 [Tripterygium wilfordii]
MQTLLQPCKFFSLLNSSEQPCFDFVVVHNSIRIRAPQSNPNSPLQKIQTFGAFSRNTLVVSNNFPVWGSTQIVSCSQKHVVDSVWNSQLPGKADEPRIDENEELELLNKPSPLKNGSSSVVDNESKKLDEEEALAPFMKFFKPRDSSSPEAEEDNGELGVMEQKSEVKTDDEEAKKINVEYYDPKKGDLVVGVVVSGNENKLDVNVGADLLGTMLTKEVLPLYEKEMEYLLCDLSKNGKEFMVGGKTGIVRNDDALNGEPGLGRPVVETGTILFAEVLGRTLSGRPLLSSRWLFRRIAWHRVRQIRQLNEPIEVKIMEWNTGGLLTRIEGLRAFLPKAELVNRVNNFTELKQNIGRRIFVRITRINEDTNDLILSEREAWEKLHLKEGTLLEGTVKKIFPYGAQIRIGETNRSGLLHVSNITRAQVNSVDELLKVDEKLKVLVVNSMFPDKISLSIAHLESEPGLFISNKEKVFAEAEEMAKRYRQKLPNVLPTHTLETPSTSGLPFDNEASMYANWKWFRFERENEVQ